MKQVEDWKLREMVRAYRHTRDAYQIMHKILLSIGAIQGELNLPQVFKTISISTNIIVKMVEDRLSCDLLVDNQSRETSKGRQAAQYLLAKYTIATLKERAILCGQKDHASSPLSVRKCIDRMDTDDEYRQIINSMEKDIDVIIKNQKQRGK